MKNIILLIFLLVVVSTATPCVAQSAGADPISDIEIQDAVILPYFQALKNGAVNEIKKYLSTAMYNEYKSLLEQNKEYPAFLRNYYDNATFSVVRTSEIDGAFEFDVRIEFPNGSQSISTLSVSQEKNVDNAVPDDNSWRISAKPFKR